MSAFVDILVCADGHYYVGSTRTTLERRVAEHNDGTYGGYTKSRRPVSLVYAQAFDRVDDAVQAERQLKGWSRAKKQALIAGDFELLVRRSKGAQRPPHPSTDKDEVRFVRRRQRRSCRAAIVPADENWILPRRPFSRL